MGVAVRHDGSRTHHDLPVHDVLLLVESDPRTGLTEDEAARRLDRFGSNELPRERAAGPVRRFARQLHNPLIYVLLAAATVTLLLHQLVDTSVIVGVVLVNAVVGFVQESKAEAALDALRGMVRTQAHVVRDGVHRQVRSEGLVPGDVVTLGAGDKVPADLRLIQVAELEIDESALTGESLPVTKDEVALPPSTPVADRRNTAYSGTLVTRGTGVGVAVATGRDTELGQIHGLVASTKPLATPLTRKVARFSGSLTVVILGLAAVTFVIGLARGEAAAEMFTAAVALAVGAIPEGLPAAVTITLAIGVARMARRGAVVRRLPAVEALGAATVVCTDKTGTLTQNRMTVRVLWTAESELQVPGPGTSSPQGAGVPDDRAGVPAGDVALRWSLLVGANCNDSRLSDRGTGLGDPTETAMLVAARAFGIEQHGLRRVDTLPFDARRQWMATTQEHPTTGADVLMVKGSVERVLELCSGAMAADGKSRTLQPADVLATAERLAAQGMRVLATAVDLRPGSDPFDQLFDGAAKGLVLTGLQAMQDPPRGTARAAVRACRTAGLDVKMVTGDHAATAASVAREVGLLDDDRPGPRSGVLTGAELELTDDERLPDAAEEAAVVARVSPAQKLRLVESLQRRGHVVAMTGDGVNDAPALRRADIGIAMGLEGTQVAQDAADLVLTDDDFATIEAAVEEGRGAFDNVTKFIVWTLPTNMGEGLVIMVAILFGATLPILPTQILWINMTTAVALGLTLAWEPKEPGIMTRPPRDPRRPLLTWPVVRRTALVSVLLVAGAWWVFEYERGHGASLAASRTAAVNVVVAVEAFYLFSCRSLTRPAWRSGPFTNRLLLAGVALQTVGQLAITYVPALNALLRTAPIGIDVWLRVLLVAALAALVVAVDKWRLRGRRP